MMDRVTRRLRPDRRTTDTVLDWVMIAVGLVCVGYGIALVMLRLIR